MSGVLQRLAARATGHAWTVRSDAALAFAAPPRIAEAEIPMDSVVATAAPTPVPEAASRPSAVPPRQHPPHAANDVQHVAEHMHTPAGPRAPTTVPDAPVHEGPSPSPTRQRSMQPGQPHAWPGTAASAPQAPPAKYVPETAGPRLRTTAARAPMARGPAPLLPTAAAPAIPAPLQRRLPSARDAAPMAAAPASSAGDTEVHVHIGRIDVTAIAAPAAPQRPARERPQPVSLGDYLARKKLP